jgi:subtilisin
VVPSLRRPAPARRPPLRRHRALAAAAMLPLVIAGAALSTAAAAEEGEARYVVVLDDAASSPAAEAAQYGAEATQTFDEAIDGFTATMSGAEAARLEADPAVAFVAEDRVLAALEPVEDAATSASQLVGNQVKRVDGPVSSTLAGNGAGDVGVNIAIVDSGVDRAHPDLNVRGGVDCSSGRPVSPGGALSDTMGHGTLVAGVAAARDNGFGVVGTAPGAPVWSVKVADANGSITISNLVCAVDWITSTRTDADPGNDIAVANISIAGGGTDDGSCGQSSEDALHMAICGSVRAGVSYVVAAGNGSHDLAMDIPAAYDEVLAVTAAADTDGRPGGAGPDACPPSTVAIMDDVVAGFSNWASSAGDRSRTVAAPGACITSTAPGGLYLTARHGTSFASPVTAGALALCLQSGLCAEGDGRETVAGFGSLTESHNRQHPDHGYEGDPFRPFEARYYGYLVSTSMF